MTPARQMGAAVAGAAVAGGLALSAGGQAWATVVAERQPPLPPVSGVLDGADAAPLVPAAGLVLLAAAVAVLAVRGAGRVAVGLLVAVAGGALAWSGVRVLTGGLDAGSEVPGSAGPTVQATSIDLSAGWPVLTVVAGLLAVAVGALVVVRGRAWPAMGRRYERDGSSAAAPPRTARAQTDEDVAQAAWKALDRGEDPTDPPSAPGAGRPV